MHHIYKTRAIVLSSLNSKESDKYINLLAEDFGFVRVMAQGIRKLESKLRTSVQDFSLTEVALVSGRTGWRLTNANLIYSIFNKISNQKLFDSLARSLRLVERLVLGESSEELFKIVISHVDFIIEHQTQITDTKQIQFAESVFVASLLEELGYLDRREFKKIIEPEMTLDLINSTNHAVITDLNKIINFAIRETGL